MYRGAERDLSTMDSSQVMNAFIRLKPLCDNFLNAPSKASLTVLVKECKGLKPSILQEVHAFILFPFTIHLRKHQFIKPPELRTSMVQVVNDIFSKTHVDSVEMYFKYFYLMIFQIFDKDSLETATLDEDFTLIVVKTITTLTLRIPDEIRFQLYTRSNATKLGQGIFVCVQLARKFQYRALRIASIQCILAVCTLHDDLINNLHKPTINAQLAESVGDVLMFFLPGLLGAMQDIARGDQKQAHAITCLAIKTIDRVLCLTMMDRPTPESSNISNEDFVQLIEKHSVVTEQPTEKPDPFGVKLRSNGLEGMKKHLERAERNKDWYEAAGEKLIILMKSLLSVQYHQHDKVRKEAAQMCADIVKYCPKNMYPSMKYILEMLITASEDCSSEVAQISREALQNFTTSEVSRNRKPLLDILEDNFSTMLMKMPRYLNKLDSDLQISGIRLFKGYLRLMTDPKNSPQRLTRILTCTYIMNRFAIIIVEIFKLECSNVKLLEKITLRDIGSPSDINIRNINYTNLSNEECVRTAMDICKILGQSDCLEIIVDYFLEQYRLDHECQKEIVFILNELLTAADGSNDRIDHLIKNVINMYIDQDNWYLPTVITKREKMPDKNETYDPSIYNPHEWTKTRTHDLYEGAMEIRYTDVSYRQAPKSENHQNGTSDDEKYYCRTILQVKSNVVHICLMTEGIGKIARNIKKRFQPYLLKTLYLILERAGHSVDMIHAAGMRALTDISIAFGLQSITDLIKMNADYFTHHVNMKLKNFTHNAGVLDVLLVVMRYSGEDVLPCFYSILNNVLDHRHKLYFQANSILFLKLFYAFVMYIKQKFPTEEDEKSTAVNSDTDQRDYNALWVIKEYNLNLNIFGKIDKDNIDKNELQKHKEQFKGLNAEDGQLQNKPPSHISMVVSILKKTLNFLPSKDKGQKLLAMDILAEGIIIIKMWEDEVLPLVHQIWSPLIHRFKENNQPLIINRAFRLFVSLAHVSKDFIRKRTVDEVIPSLCAFLLSSANDSHKKDAGSAYRFALVYKLQLCLLESLGGVCKLLNLHEKSTNDVLSATHRYLSNKQPKPLQIACIEMFKVLSSHNIGLVWIHLNSLWNDPAEINYPLKKLYIHNLKDFKCSVSNLSSEYKGNVTILLDYLKNKPY